MVLLDNAPDLTQNVISLSLAELIKTKAPKEATPDENTDAAEKVKADIKTISCEIFIDKINNADDNYSLYHTTDIAQTTALI